LKVLFDQNAPRPLARFLAHHQVIRSAELGWSLLKNGELLQAAEEDGFEVLVTADRNLAYQQNLQGRTLAIVVLPSGRWPEVEPQVPAVVGAVDGAKPGSYIEVSGDPGRRGS
jgi:predicted nuclease of predicted toxin-antitoxin system